MSEIKDSGERTEFESGAVRDMHEGKGRCDLLPLDVVSTCMGDTIIFAINLFLESEYKRTDYLTKCLEVFSEKYFNGSMETMFLELAVHFEQGAKKYGENNWQKGIPIWCYIDSAVRHYLKYLRGDTDERHDRAFVWNIVCAIWTIKNGGKNEISL